MSDIYYGVERTALVIGPYHPDEFSARARAQHLLRGAGQVYEIKATSYEDARRKLLRATSP